MKVCSLLVASTFLLLSGCDRILGQCLGPAPGSTASCQGGSTAQDMVSDLPTTNSDLPPVADGGLDLPAQDMNPDMPLPGDMSTDMSAPMDTDMRLPMDLGADLSAPIDMPMGVD